MKRAFLSCSRPTSTSTSTAISTNTHTSTISRPIQSHVMMMYSSLRIYQCCIKRNHRSWALATWQRLPTEEKPFSLSSSFSSFSSHYRKSFSSSSYNNNNINHYKRKQKRSVAQNQEHYDEWKRQHHAHELALHNYQQYWKPQEEQEPKDDNVIVIAEEWKHPSLADATWKQLLASEAAYIHFCQSCHQVLVALCSIPVLGHGPHQDRQDHSMTTTTTTGRYPSFEGIEDDDDYDDGNGKHNGNHHNHNGNHDGRLPSSSSFPSSTTRDNDAYFLNLPQKSVMYPSHHVPRDQEIVEQMETRLQLWERMGRERTVLVQALQPIGSSPAKHAEAAAKAAWGKSIPTNNTDSSNSSNNTSIHNTTSTSTPAQLGHLSSSTKIQTKISLSQWIRSLWVWDDSGATATATTTTTTDASSNGQSPWFSSRPLLVEAHGLDAYRPGQFHYNLVLGRFFFQFPRLDRFDDEHEHTWFQERASRIQQLLDQATHLEVFSKKSVRLVLRAHGDVGTLAACQQAENVYHRFPQYDRQLLRFVLFNYWKITQDHAHRSVNTDLDMESGRRSSHAAAVASASADDGSRGPCPSQHDQQAKDAYQAMERVVQILFATQSQRARNPMYLFGFHSLANVVSSDLTTTMSLKLAHSEKKYWDLVENLTRWRFGRVQTAYLLLENQMEVSSPKLTFLTSKDASTVHLLAEIYGRRGTTMQQAMRLMAILFQRYSVRELQDIVSITTFEILLQRSDSNFEFGMQLLDWMVLYKAWWPSETIWRQLLAMASDPNEMDQVWRKYQLCGAIMGGDYRLSPREATKIALNKILSETMPIRTKSDKASALFQWLHNFSTPFFFADNPHMVKHLYGVQDKPDREIYTSMFEISSQCQDWELAQKAYAKAKEQRRRDSMIFFQETYIAFLRALLHCRDDQERHRYVSEVFQEAWEYDQVDLPLLAILEEHFNDFYQQQVLSHVKGEIAR